MANRFEVILNYLQPNLLKRELREQLKHVPDTFGQITYYDEQEQLMKGHVGIEDNEPIESTWSFDYEILFQLQQHIETTKCEIRNLRLGSDNTSKVYNNPEIRTILSRLIDDLQLREKALCNASLPLKETMKRLKSFIGDLKKQVKRYTSSRVAKTKKRKQVPFTGYEFDKSVIKDPGKLVAEIYQKLEARKCVDQNQKHAFCSLFYGIWGKEEIKWKSTPRDFCAFYASLFNKSDSGPAPLNETKYKRRLQIIFTCFDVRDPNTSMRHTNKTVDSINTNLDSVSLYRQLSNIIDKHRI